MDYLKTGLLIAQARKAQGMTQQDLANRLHITDRAVSKWERGISFPDVSVLESLSEVLGLSLSQLITGDHDAAGADEPLQDGVQVFKQELRTKVRRTAWLTTAIIVGVAALVASVCILRRYIPAQKTALREIPLTVGENEIADTNGLSAARFRLQLASDVEKCQLIEEAWTPEGLVSSQVLVDIPTTWEAAEGFDLPADSWYITRKMAFTTGFTPDFEEHSYTWHINTEGLVHSCDGEYAEDMHAAFCRTYRFLSREHLSKDSAVPLMAAYISAGFFPAEFDLKDLQPGDPVSVMEGGTVRVLWLTVE